MMRPHPVIFAAAFSLTALALIDPAIGKTGKEDSKLLKDDFLDVEEFRLWPGRAEGAESDKPDETPTLTVFRVLKGAENGAAVIVAPGGGYVGLATALEGRPVADWFTSRGITAFLLKYRTGPRARLPIPLSDGRRAVQFVRANATKYGIDPNRVGMIGFSAGGHLAAMTAVQAVSGAAEAADQVDRVSSRPNFLVLAYPWLEGMKIDAKGQSQYCMFAGVNCRPEDYASFTPLQHVTGDMPPTFIYHTTNDSLVPAEGSLRFYEALHSRKVPVEMHVFGPGEHGSGMGGSDPALARWPELLEHWLRGRGLFTKPYLAPP
ncbi:alpha/beta hydrolase [Sphingobium tyrosinilyticum]|uniref:Alpha/beta hydrolase n=1 Tax=Sphingobium tyrosinilyticum TaxID=2715436 RepID=A0ABV9F1K8_9SPHN